MLRQSIYGFCIYVYIEERDVANEKDYPYTGRDGKCATVARDFRISGLTHIPSGDCQSLANAAQIEAVAVAVDASNGSEYIIQSIKRAERSEIAKKLNHGATVVGVSDDGSWPIRNFLGSDWGQSGIITLAGRDTCDVCQGASYQIL